MTNLRYLELIAFIIIFSLLVYYKYITFDTITKILNWLYKFIVLPILLFFDSVYTITMSIIEIPAYLYQLTLQIGDSLMIIFGYVFSIINYLSMLLLHIDDELI
jgi:hypothetical protein